MNRKDLMSNKKKKKNYYIFSANEFRVNNKELLILSTFFVSRDVYYVGRYMYGLLIEICFW